MNRHDISTIFQILVVVSMISIIAMMSGCAGISGHEKKMIINESKAIEIVSQDPVAEKYFSEKFKHADWRVERATLINETQIDLNNTIPEGEQLWKVEMMERTCACSGIKDLYVIEGYVSPYTGDIMANITTGLVQETQYDNKTCATTVCH
jgi:hypothetical protein